MVTIEALRRSISIDEQLDESLRLSETSLEQFLEEPDNINLACNIEQRSRR